jgi:hypothetical protein
MVNGKPDMADAQTEWEERIRRWLRVELARQNLSYPELADRLRAVGVIETHKNLSNKIKRGKFPAAFFFLCMSVLGRETIHLDQDD